MCGKKCVNSECSTPITEEFPVVGHLRLDLFEWKDKTDSAPRIMCRPAISAEEWDGKSLPDRANLIRQLFAESGEAVVRAYLSQELEMRDKNGDS